MPGMPSMVMSNSSAFSNNFDLHPFSLSLQDESILCAKDRRWARIRPALRMSEISCSYLGLMLTLSMVVRRAVPMSMVRFVFAWESPNTRERELATRLILIIED